MRFSIETERVEGFTDRVLVVILAIMVFQLWRPLGAEPGSLIPTLPVIATFALSVLLIGICWYNYHRMLRASRAASMVGRDGRIYTCCSGSHWCRSRPPGLDTILRLSLPPSFTRSSCSSVRSRTRSFGNRYPESTASMRQP